MRREFPIQNRLGLAVWYVVVSFIVAIILSLPLLIIGSHVFRGMESLPNNATFIGIFSCVISMGIAFFLLLRHHAFINEGNTFRLQNNKAILLITSVMIIAWFIPDGFIDSISNLPDNGALQNIEMEFSSIWGIIDTCLIGPFMEEVLCRGAVERSLLKWKRNPWYAIIISSLIWAALHLNLAQGLSAFTMGIGFGWIYYRTKSIWPTFLMHVINNTLCTIAWFIWSDNDNLVIFGNSWLLYGIASVIGLVITLICIYLFNRYTTKNIK